MLLLILEYCHCSCSNKMLDASPMFDLCASNQQQAFMLLYHTHVKYQHLLDLHFAWSYTDTAHPCFKGSNKLD